MWSYQDSLIGLISITVFSGLFIAPSPSIVRGAGMSGQDRCQQMTDQENKNYERVIEGVQRSQQLSRNPNTGTLEILEKNHRDRLANIARMPICAGMNVPVPTSPQDINAVVRSLRNLYGTVAHHLESPPGNLRDDPDPYEQYEFVYGEWVKGSKSAPEDARKTLAPCADLLAKANAAVYKAARELQLTPGRAMRGVAEAKMKPLEGLLGKAEQCLWPAIKDVAQRYPGSIEEEYTQGLKPGPNFVGAIRAISGNRITVTNTETRGIQGFHRTKCMEFTFTISDKAKIRRSDNERLPANVLQPNQRVTVKSTPLQDENIANEIWIRPNPPHPVSDDCPTTRDKPLSMESEPPAALQEKAAAEEKETAPAQVVSAVAGQEMEYQGYFKERFCESPKEALGGLRDKCRDFPADGITSGQYYEFKEQVLNCRVGLERCHSGPYVVTNKELYVELHKMISNNRNGQSPISLVKGTINGAQITVASITPLQRRRPATKSK